MSDQTTTLKIRKYSSIEVIKKISDVISSTFTDNTQFNIESFNLSTILLENSITLTRNNNTNNNFINEITSTLNNFKTKLESQEYILIRKFIISSKSNNNNNNCNLTYESNNDSNLFDIITFSYHNNDAKPFITLVEKLLSNLNDKFGFFKDNKIDIKFLDDENRKFLELFQSQIQELEILKLKTLNNLEEQVQKWNDSLLDANKKIQDKYLEDKDNLNKEYNDKKEELNKKELEFNERVKNFDERERTVVRRDYLEKIKTLLESDKLVKVSTATTKKRKTIDIVSIVVILVTGFIFILVILILLYKNILGEKISIDKNIIIPITSLTVLFVSTLIFYIKWSYQWYKQHADIEFYNMKFKLDILRANWLVEMFFESKENGKEVELPKEIYSSLSKNLFDATLENKYNASYPVEDIFKSLKGIKSITIGDVNIDKNNKENKDSDKDKK